MARETIEYIIPTDLDDIPDGTAYKRIAAAEATRLESCDENAEVNLTALQTQTGIVGLADADRILVGSEPTSGKKKVYGVHINASGNLEADQDTTPV